MSRQIFIAALTLTCLVMAMSAMAQNPVLDTDGHRLRAGVEYYVLPAITDVAGGLTLVNRTRPCPLYVGQERSPTAATTGLPVIFRPYAEGESVIREGRDLTVEFSAASTCVQSTTWRVGQQDAETNMRFIVTGGNKSYFRIDKNGSGVYNLAFCPTESCPNCRVACGSAGILVRDGTRFLTLDAPNPFPFRFKRV